MRDTFDRDNAREREREKELERKREGEVLGAEIVQSSVNVQLAFYSCSVTKKNKRPKRGCLA